MFSLFATGVLDTGGKFTASVVDTGGNLPPVSTTSAVLLANFPLLLLTLVANWYLVWLIPLTCEYRRKFLIKFKKYPNVIFTGLGEGDS
jgi:hypothetical protein